MRLSTLADGFSHIDPLWGLRIYRRFRGTALGYLGCFWFSQTWGLRRVRAWIRLFGKRPGKEPSWERDELGGFRRVMSPALSCRLYGFVLRSLSTLGAHLNIYLVFHSMSVEIGQENIFVNTLIESQKMSLKINNFSALDKEWEIRDNSWVLGT